MTKTILLTAAAGLAFVASVGTAAAQEARNGNTVEAVLIQNDPSFNGYRYRSGDVRVAADGSVYVDISEYDYDTGEGFDGLVRVRDGVTTRLLSNYGGTTIDGRTIDYFGGGIVFGSGGTLYRTAETYDPDTFEYQNFVVRLDADGTASLAGDLPNGYGATNPGVGDLTSASLVGANGGNLFLSGTMVTATDPFGGVLTRDGIFVRSANGTVTPVAIQGAPVNGVEGATFEYGYNPIITTDGTLFTNASLIDPGTGGYVGEALVAVGTDGSANIAYQSGQTIGDTDLTSSYASIHSTDGAGNLILQSYVYDEDTYEGSDVYFSVSADGTSEFLFDVADLIEGSGFGEGSYFESLAVGGEGIAAFTMSEYDYDTDEFRASLFGRTSDGLVTELLRNGDELLVNGTLERLTSFYLVTGALAATGDVVFEAYFESGLSGLFSVNIFADVAPVPLPAGALLLVSGLGLGAGLRRARRS